MPAPEMVIVLIPHGDTEVFQAFLDTMAAEDPKKKDKLRLQILDNASCDKTMRPVRPTLGYF